MEISDLVLALMRGDLLLARQWVADAQRENMRWDTIPEPTGLNDKETVIAAAMIELLASRAGVPAPGWTGGIGAVDEEIVLDPGLELMPRSFARAKATTPEALRKRNLVALPEFLEVA